MNDALFMQENIYPALIVFCVFFAISVIISMALKKISKHFDTASSEVFNLLANSQKTILIFCGIVMALSKVGFDVSALVAGLGLTGFALGFALKDAISNLVAGVMIVMYKPIELGNVIETEGIRGSVANINLRYITVKSEDAVHLIPNSILVSKKVSVFNAQAKASFKKSCVNNLRK